MIYTNTPSPTTVRGQQRGAIQYQHASILKRPGNPTHVLNLRDANGNPRYLVNASGIITRVG